MNVGDYVRTKSYGIKKINGFSSTLEEDFIDCDYDKYQRVLINKKEVIKSSPNIIDLIEVGDVLVIKDFVDDACVIFTDIYLIQNETQLLNIKSDLEKNKNKKLYSIVTKEQFESMEYKVGE